MKMDTKNGTNLAIALLETILDIKEMPKEMKKILRDLTGPALEYVGNGPTPKEVMVRVKHLKIVMQIPIALGMYMSVHPKSYQEVALDFREKDYEELIELLEVLISIADPSKEESVNMEPTG